MNVIGMMLLVAALMPSATWHEEEEALYEELVFQAIDDCRTLSSKNVDETLMWELVRVEQRYDVPNELRGMLLAQACGESGFNRFAKGDWTKSKTPRARAIGLFQMWSWWESDYGIDRTKPKEVAGAYMKHVSRMLKKVRKQCRYRSESRQWIAAWVTAIRAPKKGGRCRELPNHLKILKRWHRNIKKLRKFQQTQDELDDFGC